MKKYVVLIGLVGILCCNSAKADFWNDFLRIQCLPELKSLYMTVEHPRTSEELQEKLLTQSADYIQKYGLYNLQALYKLDNNDKILWQKSYNASCKIDNRTFEVQINALNPKKNYKIGDKYQFLSGEGSAGIYQQFYLTVKMNNKVIIDALEAVSPNNGRMITSVQFDLTHPSNPLLDVHYNWDGDDMRADWKVYNRTFFLDKKEFTPVTSENFWIYVDFDELAKKM